MLDRLVGLGLGPSKAEGDAAAQVAELCTDLDAEQILHPQRALRQQGDDQAVAVVPGGGNAGPRLGRFRARIVEPGAGLPDQVQPQLQPLLRRDQASRLVPHRPRLATQMPVHQPEPGPVPLGEQGVDH